MKKQVRLSTELIELALALMEIFKRSFRSNRQMRSLSFTQFKILYAVDSGIRHVGLLAETFSISQPAMSKMVDTLVDGKLVKRRPHATDRRQIELHLTNKAQRRVKSAYEMAALRIEERISKFKGKKRKTLAKDIRDLTQDLIQLD